jgi:hypothetical protein
MVDLEAQAHGLARDRRRVGLCRMAGAWDRDLWVPCNQKEKVYDSMVPVPHSAESGTVTESW